MDGNVMRDGWRLEVAELRFAKRYEEALAIVREAISEGDMSAHVMLAVMGDSAGLSREEVNRLIEYVEANMDPRDLDAHLQLSGAYDLRLGTMPYEERAIRHFDHLLKAGELGAGAIVSLAIARIYRTGALGVAANQAESVRWYKRAIEQGSIEAASELQGLYRKLDKHK